MKHKHIGGAGDDHLAAWPLADHADAKRAIHIAALVKHRLLVGLAVGVGVFENEDSVALFAGLLLATVIKHLAHPDAAPRIDVDVGRAREQRLGREERGREVVGQFECVGSGLAGGCQAHAEKRCQTSPDTDAIHALQLHHMEGDRGTVGEVSPLSAAHTNTSRFSTRNPPAPAGGFYFSNTTTSPGRKSGDTASLGEPVFTWHVGRWSHPESPGSRRGLVVMR